MKEVLQVTEAKGSQEARFLTLTDCSGNSENRYYVCLTGLAGGGPHHDGT